MMLRQPHGIKAHPLRLGDLRERFVESRRLRTTIADVEIGKHSEIH